MFVNGKNLGSAQANRAAVDANNEWYYDSSIDTCYYFDSSNNPQTLLMEAGEDNATFKSRMISNASAYFTSKVDATLPKEMFLLKDGSYDYFIKRTLQYQYSLQSVCENLTIPYYHFSMLSPWHIPEGYACGAKVGSETEKWPEAKDTFIPEEAWIAKFMSETLYQKIDERNYIGWPIHKKIGGFCMFDLLQEKHRISEMDYHPNKEGHKEITDIILNGINKIH